MVLFQKNIRVQTEKRPVLFSFFIKKVFVLFRDCQTVRLLKKRKKGSSALDLITSALSIEEQHTPSFPPLFSYFLDDDKYLCWKQRTFLRGALSRRAKRSSFGGELDALGIYTECGGDLVWKHFVVTRGRSPFLFLFFLNKRNAFRRRFRRRETETCYNKRERKIRERTFTTARRRRRRKKQIE